MFKQKNIVTLICAMLMMSWLAAGCASLGAKPPATPAPDTAIEAEPTINATGVMVPAQYATLSVSAPGLVAEILVKEGEPVQAGQVLARLKGKEDYNAAITAAKLEMVTAQQALDELDRTASVEKAAALQAIAEANRTMRDAQWKLDNYTVPDDIAKLEPVPAVAAMKQKLDQARTAFEPWRNRSEFDSTRKDLKEDLDTAQRDYDVAVRRLEYTVALSQAQAQHDKAMQDYEAVQAGPDPKKVAVAQARLENAQATMNAAQANLNDLELRAGFAGTVTKVHARLGEWLTPGQPVLQVADLTHLRAETTDLNEIDVARVSLNDEVKVTFDAIPNLAVAGRVTHIASKASEGSGVNYTVQVELDELPPALRWGMTAFVDIKVK